MSRWTHILSAKTHLYRCTDCKCGPTHRAQLPMQLTNPLGAVTNTPGRKALGSPTEAVLALEPQQQGLPGKVRHKPRPLPNTPIRPGPRSGRSQGQTSRASHALVASGSRHPATNANSWDCEGPCKIIPSLRVQLKCPFLQGTLPGSCGHG